MTIKIKTGNPIFVDIWVSFSSMPFWVKTWMIVFLVPINFLSLLFLEQPMGMLIATLATGGILPNVVVLFYERGFSRLMALVHVLPWSVLVFIILTNRHRISEVYETYLLILAAINIISLAFDIPETVQWIKGKRETLGLN